MLQSIQSIYDFESHVRNWILALMDCMHSPIHMSTVWGMNIWLIGLKIICWIMLSVFDITTVLMFLVCCDNVWGYCHGSRYLKNVDFFTDNSTLYMMLVMLTSLPWTIISGKSTFGLLLRLGRPKSGNTSRGDLMVLDLVECMLSYPDGVDHCSQWQSLAYLIQTL